MRLALSKPIAINPVANASDLAQSVEIDTLNRSFFSG